MRKIRISGNNGIEGFVYPEYGGMLGRLRMSGRDIFALDEERLALSPLLGGGNPVLFPFPSKTKDDTYTLDGKQYYMPFHGLVTNSAFCVEEEDEKSVTLSLRNSPSWKKSHYPFDFELKLTYAVEDNGVCMNADIINLSETNMPHGFGWHCYFTVSDKANLKLEAPMKRYIDYTDGSDKEGTDADLCVKTDYVFYDKTGCTTVIKNPVDGYEARLISDDAFEVLTVCSRFDGRLCVEPWIGLPDSANTGRYIEWIEPGEHSKYTTKIVLKDLKGI